MLDDESQEDLRANKNLGVYKGALYENIVGEALVKQHYKLYYYKRDTSTLETDFFIRSMTSLIPVEVKAATGKAKSMNTLISSDRYPDIRYGFKIFCAKYRSRKLHLYVPLFLYIPSETVYGGFSSCGRTHIRIGFPQTDCQQIPFITNGISWQ